MFSRPGRSWPAAGEKPCAVEEYVIAHREAFSHDGPYSIPPRPTRMSTVKAPQQSPTVLAIQCAAQRGMTRYRGD
jgi:hypothetical protein